MSSERIILTLSPDVAAGLAAVAEQEGTKAPALAARVLASWLGPCRKVTDAERTAMQLRVAGLEAARRLSILQRWWDARRTGRNADAATASFLARLTRDGETICRATLYNWEKRWAGAGIDGLLDNRSDRGPKSPGAFAVECLARWRSSRHRNLCRIHREVSAMAGRKGWKIVSVEAVRQYIQRAVKDGLKPARTTFDGHSRDAGPTLAPRENKPKGRSAR